MRLTESKIKEAIFHPDQEIRNRAARYFAKSYSLDPEITPLVIQSVEKDGKENAYHLIGLARDLHQCEETIAWVIDELNAEKCGNYENYAYNLSMVLVEADPVLLLPRESDILEARHFLAELRTPLIERLRMLSWDEATCWQKLEEFCEEGKDKQYINEVNLGYANRIVEALSRFAPECEAKVHQWLSLKPDDDAHHPMKWMEPLVVRLAGQARLESTVPLIVERLHEDAELLDEECSKAMTMIGTPAVLHAIAEEYPTAEEHFRIYATSPLENIHSDLAVETCLNLFETEKEEYIQRRLAESLLYQFAYEGIEIARKLLVGRKIDFDLSGLRKSLLDTCTIMGERFPEYDDWLATVQDEKIEHRKRVKELENDPRGMLLFALEKITGKKASEATKTKSFVSKVPSLTLPHIAQANQKVDRNARARAEVARSIRSAA